MEAGAASAGTGRVEKRARGWPVGPALFLPIAEKHSRKGLSSSTRPPSTFSFTHALTTGTTSSAKTPPVNTVMIRSLSGSSGMGGMSQGSSGRGPFVRPMASHLTLIGASTASSRSFHWPLALDRKRRTVSLPAGLASALSILSSLSETLVLSRFRISHRL